MKNILKSWLQRRRPHARGYRNSRLSSRLVPAQLETLENRALLSAITARLTIFSNGSPVDIPADLGVAGGSPVSQIHTVDGSGNICIEPIGSEPLEDQTLGDFFEMWRTNAGDAGNNADAVFSGTQLMTATTDFNNTIQVFVNGEINTDFDSYIIQDQDEIVIVYGGDPVVSINTNLGPVVIELFENEAPGTVGNFLKYINDGDYINSFFHRSDPGFVVQGGGFTTSSTDFTSTSQFTPVPTDPPILNEPGFSNTRTTVAMAKNSDPNSATSQYFVNLGDNSELDLPQNGAFTVFGQVLDMTTIDEIEALDISNFGTPFAELPLTDNDQLAVVMSIEGAGTISGTRFEDVNVDGVFDIDDTPLAGVIVYIDANGNEIFDSGEINATTDSEGRYRIDLAPGTYTVRAVISSGQVLTVPTSGEYVVDVQIGGDPAGRDFGETTMVAPTGVDLADATDTGVSQSDNLTNLNNATSQSTLQFLVTGTLPGARVEVRADGVVIGMTTANGDSVTIITDGSTQLADGSREITATQTLQSTTSTASAPLTINVDSTAPGDFTVLPPDTIPVNTTFTLDIESPDELDAQYSLFNEPTGLSINSTGVMTWTPTFGQATPHEFQIHLSDAAGNRLIADVEMTVVTDVPALPDEYGINENATLTVDETLGALANDGPPQNGTLTAQLVETTVNGTLTLNTDGSFEYIPNAGFFGMDEFTYRALDGIDPTNVAKVSITVHQVNALPVGVDDDYDTNEDIPLNVNSTDGVLFNDTDADNDLLSATLLTGPSSGALVLNEDGSFVYTPNLNFFGTDSFTYELSDGQDPADNPVTVNLTVNSVNDRPVAEPDSYTLNEDTSLVTTAINGVLSNDTDLEGSELVATVVSQPDNGTLTFNADGTFIYTPRDNFFGVDQFTYFASDGDDPSLTIIVSLTVDPLPDPPSANADQLTTAANGQEAFLDVLANDSSVPDEDQPFVVTAVSGGSAGGILTVTDSGDGVLYTPPTNFVGTETFTYTIEDTDDLTATATATVETTVAPGTAESSLRGVVYVDSNGNGLRDDGESGIPGVEIQLSGNTVDNEFVSTTFITDDEGEWEFTAIQGGTWQVAETQPTAFVDGSSSAGTSGGDAAASNTVSNIVLNGLNSATDIDFGESHMSSEHVSIAWRFASSFAEGARTFKNLMADIEASADRTDLADAIRVSADTVDNNTNTGETVRNTFTIDESASNGSTVGVIAAASTFSAPLVYEFDDPTLLKELELLPDDHLSGDLTASVVLIEYLDFQCPACAAAHPLIAQLEQDLAGDVLVVRRHFPLTTIHFNAFAAARAAEAAGRQGTFEEMGTLLFENQNDWEFVADPQSSFETYANQLGLDITQFRSDMNDTTIDDRINRDIDAGTSLGVNSTPTFFLNGTTMANPTTQSQLNTAVQAEVDAVDSPFAIHRTNGNLIVRDTSLLDAQTTPTVILPVNVTDSNGLQERVSVTIRVTNDTAAGPLPGAVDSVFSEPDRLLSEV